MNLLSNTCVNGTFFNKITLADVLYENCEKTEPAMVEATCEVIEKCAIGENCCILSKFKNDSPWELKWIEQETDDKIDAIFYNSNQNVEYLLLNIYLSLRNLKVYDASNCSIREIFWVNFKRCYKLESINLANNQISALNEKLFEEMPLKILDLCNFIFICFS